MRARVSEWVGGWVGVGRARARARARTRELPVTATITIVATPAIPSPDSTAGDSLGSAPSEVRLAVSAAAAAALSCPLSVGAIAPACGDPTRASHFRQQDFTGGARPSRSRQHLQIPSDRRAARAREKLR